VALGIGHLFEQQHHRKHTRQVPGTFEKENTADMDIPAFEHGVDYMAYTH
jgi:hypothetical protein